MDGQELKISFHRDLSIDNRNHVSLWTADNYTIVDIFFHFWYLHAFAKVNLKKSARVPAPNAAILPSFETVALKEFIVRFCSNFGEKLLHGVSVSGSDTLYSFDY